MYHHMHSTTYQKRKHRLIEVMGLAVLPARLKEELEILADYLVEGKRHPQQ